MAGLCHLLGNGDLVTECLDPLRVRRVLGTHKGESGLTVPLRSVMKIKPAIAVTFGHDGACGVSRGRKDHEPARR